jgi:hypothetical protein
MNSDEERISQIYDLADKAIRQKFPHDIKHLNRPIIGYVGVISDWFDFDLLELMASSFKDCSILLVGPIAGKNNETVSGIRARCPNITCVGIKSYEQLPYYICAMDVCTIPFKVNALSNAADTNKLYEYAACAKPIVTMQYSTDWEQLRGIIYIAISHGDFIKGIELALKPADICILREG